MIHKIHVLEVTKSTAGVAEYNRWIANDLNKDRFKLTIACMSEGGIELADELSKIKEVHALSIPMDRYRIAPISDISALKALSNLIRNSDINLIHAHGSKPGYLARLAAGGTQIPVIYSPHCFSFHPGTPKWVGKFYAALERFAAHYLTRKIIVVADAELKLGLENLVGTPDQYITIHSGIDVSPFDVPFDPIAVRTSLRVPTSSLLIGVVGRLNRQKNPHGFIEAAHQVNHSRPDVHFIWIGDGPLKDSAVSLVTKFSLEDRFHFAGFRKDVPLIMRALDVFVLPSLWEAFPITILEAMAASLPIVATNVMGIPEAVIDHKTGILVPPDDSDALSTAILRLLDNSDYAKDLGRKGRERVEARFLRSQMIEKISKIYENMVE